MLKIQKKQKSFKEEINNTKSIISRLRLTSRNKGITLVALVITVIVLLILAGVSISVLTGGEGLFTKTKEAAEKYNEAAKNEAEMFNLMMAGEWEELFTKKLPADGNFDKTMGLNAPDTSKLSKETTYYVTWNKVGPSYTEVFTSIPVMNWYNYNESKWANIKTTSTDENLEAYWVWIPRFAYKLPENGRVAKTIEVAFVEGTGKTVVLENGQKEQGYYATDSEITTDNSGVYTKKTTDAHTKWIIHPAFTFGDKQLSGIWIAKYEASSTNPTEANGGGNVTNQKVQVKPNVTSWRYITAANSFINCRAIQNDGGALGTATGNTEVDTHMMKNVEWGAVAILSQSKYGYYDRGTNTNLQVWNNPSDRYITGQVGVSKDLGTTSSASCYTYNTEQGIKASTTGNIYGIYDMAEGTWEQVAGTLNRPDILGTPESKYYDLYIVGSYDGGKIGDMTRECLPASNVSWNGDYAYFVDGTRPLFYRSGDHVLSTASGVFAFGCNTGDVFSNVSFRPAVAVF